MIPRRKYVENDCERALVVRSLLEKFGNSICICSFGCRFACPPIGQEFEILASLEFPGDKTLEPGIYRIARHYGGHAVYHHMLFLEKYQNGSWIDLGGLEVGRGILDWRWTRPVKVDQQLKLRFDLINEPLVSVLVI